MDDKKILNEEDVFYRSMYGYEEEKEKNPNRVAAGMRAAGVATHSINIGDKQVEFATARYVRTLEDQIKAMKREMSDLKNALNRLIQNHNRTVNRIDMMNRDINEKNVFGE